MCPYWLVIKADFVFGCVRMRILRCGFMDLALEQCLQFLPARITASSRDRINKVGDFGKVNNRLLSILDPLVTLISITLRVGYLWNTLSRILGKQALVVLKANHQNRPNKYGKTATNPSFLFTSRFLLRVLMWVWKSPVTGFKCSIVWSQAKRRHRIWPPPCAKLYSI